MKRAQQFGGPLISCTQKLMVRYYTIKSTMASPEKVRGERAAGYMRIICTLPDITSRPRKHLPHLRPEKHGQLPLQLVSSMVPDFPSLIIQIFQIFLLSCNGTNLRTLAGATTLVYRRVVGVVFAFNFRQ